MSESAAPATLLALDGACRRCSVALWRDGAVIAHRGRMLERGHAAILMPLVADTLAAAGLVFADVTLLAATVGPGSFTGVRTVLAAARGLALALGRPLAGVTTLEAVAYDARRAAPAPAPACLVVLDSRRADLYAQVFEPDGTPRQEPGALMPEDIAAALPDREILLAGNARDSVEPALRARGIRVRPAPGDGEPDAAAVAAIAARRALGAAERRFPTPLYLRPPDAVKPPAGGRLRP